MNEINHKKSLILIATVGLLALVAFSPSVFGNSLTVVPNKIVNTYGTQTGQLTDIQYEDGSYVKWNGKSVGWFQYKIDTKIYFPEVEYVIPWGNEFEMEFRFSGGNVLNIKIYYTDGTIESYTQSSCSWKKVTYDLNGDKVVDYVRLSNHEWWYAGWVEVDYMEVNYNRPSF